MSKLISKNITGQQHFVNIKTKKHVTIISSFSKKRKHQLLWCFLKVLEGLNERTQYQCCTFPLHLMAILVKKLLKNGWVW